MVLPFGLIVLQVDFALGMFHVVAVILDSVIVVVDGDEGIGDHHGDTDQLFDGVFSNSRQRTVACAPVVVVVVGESCRCRCLVVIAILILIISCEFAIFDGGFGVLAGTVVHVEGVVGLFVVVGFGGICLSG